MTSAPAAEPFWLWDEAARVLYKLLQLDIRPDHLQEPMLHYQLLAMSAASGLRFVTRTQPLSSALSPPDAFALWASEQPHLTRIDDERAQQLLAELQDAERKRQRDSAG